MDVGWRGAVHEDVSVVVRFRRVEFEAGFEDAGKHVVGTTEVLHAVNDTRLGGRVCVTRLDVEHPLFRGCDSSAESETAELAWLTPGFAVCVPYECSAVRVRGRSGAQNIEVPVGFGRELIASNPIPTVAGVGDGRDERSELRVCVCKD